MKRRGYYASLIAADLVEYEIVRMNGFDVVRRGRRRWEVLQV
jgi:hypothetical protein